MIALIEQTRVHNTAGKFGILINKTNSKTLLHRQLSQLLAESDVVRLLSSSIKSREIYPQAAALGRTVFDVKGLRGVKVAQEEVRALYEEIVALLDDEEAAEVANG